jgi:hypothetical protein
MPRPGTNPVDPKSLDRMKPVGTGLSQEPGTLAHSIIMNLGSAWPKDVPFTTGHLTKIAADPKVAAALEGKPFTAENINAAVAAQPADYWKSWIASNIEGAEKVTRQTQKPAGKAGAKTAPEKGKAATGNTGGDLSPMRKRLLELDMKPEDVAKMTDDEVTFNVESIEKALAKSRSKSNPASESAKKKQAKRDENAAKRQRQTERAAKKDAKITEVKPKPAPRTKAVGSDKDVVSTDGEEQVAGTTTAVDDTTDIDGLSVEQLQEMLAKARVRDAMGATQDVGVRLGQPGSTFADMSSGSPAMDAVPGVASAGSGSINVGAGMTPELAERLKTEINPLTGTTIGAPGRSVPVVNGQLAGSFDNGPPKEPFFKGLDFLRGNPFGQYQRTDAATGNPLVNQQGDPVMADRWGRAAARNSLAPLVKYGVPAAAAYYGSSPIISAVARWRGQQPAADSNADADAILARLKMEQRFNGSRPVYAPDTPPVQ